MPRTWFKWLPKRLRWRLEEREYRRYYPEEIKKLRASNKDIRGLQDEFRFELREIEEARLSLSQSKLLKKARKRGIPIPR